MYCVLAPPKPPGKNVPPTDVLLVKPTPKVTGALFGVAALA